MTAAGGEASAETCDVADPVAMNDLAARVLKSHGAPTLLANNAGIARTPGGTALDGSVDVFRRVMDVNFMGAVNGCQAFVPAMLEAGTDCYIVNTGSKQVFHFYMGSLHMSTDGHLH